MRRPLRMHSAVEPELFAGAGQRVISVTAGYSAAA